MTNGITCFDEFRRTGSSDAFTGVVKAYTGLVYSTALRRIRDADLARDIAQEVFQRLAKNPPEIAEESRLLGWLHRATTHITIDTWRQQSRREIRQEHAILMNALTPNSDSIQIWRELEPILDEVIDQLPDKDREAILGRFFHGKPFRELGESLGLSEDATKMRVSRALDKLRTLFAQRGISCPVAMLSLLLLENAGQGAPAPVILQLIKASYSLKSVPMLLKSILAIAAAFLIVAAYQLQTRKESSRPTIEQASGAIIDKIGAKKSAGAGETSSGSARAEADSTVDLLAQLRALLTRPPAERSFPPTPLRALLAKFGSRMMEAVPILMEAAESNDYQTRVWAVSGLEELIVNRRTMQGQTEASKQVFTMVRPVLSKILLSPDEPQMLRLLALHSYLPPAMSVNGKPMLLDPLDIGPQNDLIQVLQASDRDRFAFEVLDQLAGRLVDHPSEKDAFLNALLPLLESQNQQQKLLAAYALASSPGDKIEEIKSILLSQLSRDNINCSRAATGLGKLGPLAKDILPQLLAYARQTESLKNGSAENALRAVCQVDPTFRARNPEIDQRFKLQEEGIASDHQLLATVLNLINRAKNGEDVADPLRKALSEPVESIPNREEAKSAILGQLHRELAVAPEEQKERLSKVIQLLQDTQVPNEAPVESKVLFGNLTLEARLLLSDQPNSTIQKVVESFENEYLPPGSKTDVNRKNFELFMQKLRNADPEFASAWKARILKNLPSLDRMIADDHP